MVEQNTYRVKVHLLPYQAPKVAVLSTVGDPESEGHEMLQVICLLKVNAEVISDWSHQPKEHYV